MANVKAFGEIMMRLVAPNHLLLRQSNHLEVSYSGTGLNVLSGLGQFGHHVSMITTLPDNMVGDAAISHIQGLGVSTKDILRNGSYLGQYFLERGYSIRPSKVVYSNRKESSFCQSRLADYDLGIHLEDVDMIHFCGIMLAISDKTRDLAIKMAEAASRKGITVVFDCNYRPKLWKENGLDPQPIYEKMLNLANICLMTEKDAIHIFGIQTKEKTKQGQIEDVLPVIKKKFNIQLMAGLIRDEDQFSQSHKGFLYDGDFCYSQQFTYRTLERIGAGDGFSSGILHGSLTGLNRNDWINFAAAAGALAHTTCGDSPVCSEDEVWDLVHGKHLYLER